MTRYTVDDRDLIEAVFLNGRKVDYCFFADTRRGVVRVFRFPFRPDKYKRRVLTKTLRGRVEVLLRR